MASVTSAVAILWGTMLASPGSIGEGKVPQSAGAEGEKRELVLLEEPQNERPTRNFSWHYPVFSRVKADNYLFCPQRTSGWEAEGYQRYRLGEREVVVATCWRLHSGLVLLYDPAAEGKEGSRRTSDGSLEAWLVRLSDDFGPSGECPLPLTGDTLEAFGNAYIMRLAWLVTSGGLLATQVRDFVWASKERKRKFPHAMFLRGSISIRLKEGRTQKLELDLESEEDMPMAPWFWVAERTWMPLVEKLRPSDDWDFIARFGAWAIGHPLHALVVRAVIPFTYIGDFVGQSNDPLVYREMKADRKDAWRRARFSGSFGRTRSLALFPRFHK